MFVASMLALMMISADPHETPQSDDPPQAKTVAAEPLPKAITSFGAAVVEGRVWVYGGHHGEAHHYSIAGQSDTLQSTPADKPAAWRVDAKGPRLQGLSLEAHQAALYRVGGFTARNKEGEEQDLHSQRDFAVYVPAKGEWIGMPDMPTSRSSFDSVVLDGVLYVVGGWALRGEKDSVWREKSLAFDLAAPDAKWTELPQQPFQRRALTVGAAGGKVYAIGGIDKEGKTTTKVDVYDPQKKAWSKGPALPGKSMEGFGADCCTVDGRLYVSTISGMLLRLSADGAKWETIAKLPRPRFFHRMLTLPNGQIMLIAGADMNQGKFAEVEVLDVGKLGGGS